MCGICGYLFLTGEREANPALLQRMTLKLTHRGPDSTGFFLDGNIGLGFTRLSIIDPEGGTQPLYNEDKSVVMICNGEIFNYIELKRDLMSAGHKFRTRTDVEVILHLYEDEGKELLNKLNGQFAFAIYDKNKRQLFIARDPVGINPLFYTVTDESFVFASEIKAILAHPAVRPEIDLTGLDQLVSFPGLVSPRTTFRDIWSLPSGHYAVVKDGQIAICEYWDLDYPTIGETCYHKPERYYVETLDALLTQAVRYRLQADVPVGAYLSGGLDSALIAAKMREPCSNHRFHSFSIAFNDSSISEAKYQRLVAQFLGTLHHEVPSDWSDVISLLPAAVYHSESPLKETYNTASLLLSRWAKKMGTSVILTGEGADELFGGYVGYRFDALRSMNPTPMPDDVSALLERELRSQLWGDENLFYEKEYGSLRELKKSLYSQHLGENLSKFDCFNHDLVNRERIRGRHVIHQRSYLDFKLRLSDHLLADHGDRMAMANSVEARYPFLDREVINITREIPPSLKVNEFAEKYILRRLADGAVPPEVLRREKFAFVAPGGSVLLQHAPEWVEDILSPERIKREGYFNPLTIEQLKLKYRREGFRLYIPFEDDLLMLVLTFGIFREAFNLPCL